MYMDGWLPRWLKVKEFTRPCRRHRFDPWVRKTPWRRKWQLTPVFLPGKNPMDRGTGRGYSPWGHKESDMTEQLNTHTHTHTHTYMAGPLRCSPETMTTLSIVYISIQNKKLKDVSAT